ncbi:MAG: hypothetical protein IJP48_02495 [Synergistaceae bacterium]|nr:hypothetical protein [Synergistaceae bacterium]
MKIIVPLLIVIAVCAINPAFVGRLLIGAILGAISFGILCHGESVQLIIAGAVIGALVCGFGGIEKVQEVLYILTN